MTITHIYIETDSVSNRHSVKQFGYILECEGIEETKQGFGEHAGTWHAAVLAGIADALERFNYACEIHVHSPDEFVLSMWQKNLAGWKRNDFRKHDGKEIKNRMEWEQLWKSAHKYNHMVICEVGSHSYSRWLKETMEERKRQAGEQGTLDLR